MILININLKKQSFPMNQTTKSDDWKNAFRKKEPIEKKGISLSMKF